MTIIVAQDTSPLIVQMQIDCLMFDLVIVHQLDHGLHFAFR